MALFQVDGWDLESNKVAFDDANSKKSRNKIKKDKRNKEISMRKSKEGNSREEFFAKQISAEMMEDLTENEPQQAVEKDNKRKRKPEDDEVKNAVAPPATKKPLTALQQKMMAKLTGSRFRWINEQLYTITSEEALKLIKEQPQLFDEYHDGFRSQVQSWPENPVDVFVEQFHQRVDRPVNAPGGLPGLSKDKKIVVADMGCGEAQLSLDVANFFSQYNKKARKYHKKNCVVHSFDLKRVNKRITVADIRNVPLPDESCTIVVFCLALMGTNFLDFIKEAYRILAPRGELWIAEIKSRFADGKGQEFVNALKLMGFFHKKTDDDNKMFTRFEFFKPPNDIIEERKAKLERKQKFIEVETEKEELEKKRTQAPEGKWLLKPCIYKRR